MTRRGLLIAMMASVLGSCFICFPVLAENPVSIEIVEITNDETGEIKPWEDIMDALPGTTYSAIPHVKNSGSAEVIVRMCLVESARDAAGEMVTLPTTAFTIDTSEYWTPDDGVTSSVAGTIIACYRYITALETGAMTEPLFHEVTLSPVIANVHQNVTFSLHLDAFAVESLPNEMDGSSPNVPDTGAATRSEALVLPAAILLTAGAVTLIGMTVCLLAHTMRQE